MQNSRKRKQQLELIDQNDDKITVFYASTNGTTKRLVHEYLLLELEDIKDIVDLKEFDRDVFESLVETTTKIIKKSTSN